MLANVFALVLTMGFAIGLANRLAILFSISMSLLVCGEKNTN